MHGSVVAPAVASLARAAHPRPPLAGRAAAAARPPPPARTRPAAPRLVLPGPGGPRAGRVLGHRALAAAHPPAARAAAARWRARLISWKGRTGSCAITSAIRLR